MNDVRLGYSINKKVSINVGSVITAYRDLIFKLAVFDPEIKITRNSFENMGTARLIMLMLNGNYPVTKIWNVSINARVAHGKVQGTVNNIPVTNQGIMPQISASSGYKFKKNWRLNANLNFNGRNQFAGDE